jgi:hypothetical protein
MHLNEAKELLKNAGYIVEGAKTDDAFLAHINRQRTNKPRTNLIPAQEAQLTAYTKVMAIVDDLVNWISENGEDSGVSEYILNQLLKAQKIEKQAQSVK